MAKRSGAKKTTDFGSCRDLSGRRLRHVNDEILLKKWQVFNIFALYHDDFMSTGGEGTWRRI